jgi:hypothetical protein
VQPDRVVIAAAEAGVIRADDGKEINLRRFRNIRHRCDSHRH